MSSSTDARETAWKIHGAIGDWTARVDAKASFALTLQSAALAGIVALSGEGHRLSSVHHFGRFLLWVGGLLILAGAVLAVLVVVPRLRRSKELRKEAPKSFIYFGHLQHWDPVELERALQKNDILPVLSRQLVNTSKIAWRKHRFVQLSFVMSFAGGLLVFLVAIFA